MRPLKTSVNIRKQKCVMLNEIHAFMLANGGKVTNHALVKHFREYLTDPHTQSEYNVCGTVKSRRKMRSLVQCIVVVIFVWEL